MGNAPSFEAAPPPPRKPPHKLSKPRVGNHATTTAGLLSSNGFSLSTSSSSTARLSNSHASIGGGQLPTRPKGRDLPPPPPPTKPTRSSTAATSAAATPTPNPRTSVGAPPPALNRVTTNPTGGGAVVAPEEMGKVEEPMVTPPTPPRKNSFQRAKRAGANLFRSRSSQGYTERKPWRASTGLVTPTLSNGEWDGDGLSRANTMTYDTSMSQYYGGQTVESWYRSENRSSRNYDMSSYEAKRLMLDLAESPTAYEAQTTMSESRFDVVSESTWKSSHPPGPPGPPSMTGTSGGDLPRTQSDLSLYTPMMRRRSTIRTPGVATRSAPTVPTLTLEKKLSFRYSQPTSPTLSRRNSIDDNERIFSLPPRLDVPEGERAVTPCESDYKQLGVMKFGSLRITNGAPSPYAERRKEKSKDGEYFGNDSQFSLESDRKGTKGKGKMAEPRPTSYAVSPITATFMKLETGSSRPNSHVQVPSKENEKESESDRKKEKGKQTAKGTNYLSDVNLGSSPLSIPRTATPELQTTSKHTAQEDDLFEDDMHTEIVSLEVLDVREDPNAKKQPTPQKKDASQTSVRIISRTDSGFVSSPTSEYSHKTLSKADSGYSSNVSLRSLRNSKPPPPDKELPPCPKQSPRRPAIERTSSSTSSFLGELRLPSPTIDLTLMEPNREAPPPPLPPKDTSPSASPASSTVTKSSNSRSSRPHVAHLATLSKIRPSPAPLTKTPPKSYDSGPQSPASAQLSPASSETSSSALSIGSGSQRPGKLQRLLSGHSMRGPPSVHFTHPVEKSAHIPTVPQEVEAKLIEHTGLFPLATKRLALRPQPSKETLGTIFSVGSAEVAHAEDVRKKEEPKIKRRRSIQSLQASLAHAAASVMPSRKSISISRKPLASKNEKDDSPDVSLSEGDDVINVENLGQTLSKSAFDQAFAAMSGERDAYFNNHETPRRSMTVTPQMERSLATRSSGNSPTNDSLSPDPELASQSSSPQTMPELYTPKQMRPAPPVSMRTRPGSVRNLRVPPPLRPQSTPTGLARSNTTALTRQSSRENIHSYPPTFRPGTSTSQNGEPMASSIPPMHPRRASTVTGATGQPMSAPLSSDNDWMPRRSVSQYSHSRTSSMSSQGSSAPYVRPASASPYSEKQLRAQQQPLRHRSSYDGHTSTMGRGQPGQGQGHPKPYVNQSYQRQSPDPWTSTHYRQLQQQYGGGGWDSRGKYHPPYVPRSGHHRNRSSGSSKHPAHPPQAPYRILHSYNSPAYRHAPIWG